MMLKRAVVIAMLAVTGTVSARPDAGASRVPPPAQNPVAPPAPSLSGLAPRRELPKPVSIVRPAGESRLFIKFRDDVRARATPTLGITAAPVRDADMLPILAAQYQLKFTCTSRRSDAELKAITDRAALLSHKAQPDLGGMMYVDGDPNLLQAAAQALLQLDCVEYAQFERPLKPAGGTGACCVGVDGTINCVDGIDQDTCETAGGLYEGDGSTCAGLPGGVCPVIGGCCLNTTDCEPLTEVQCVGLGGAYKGDGSNCVQDQIDCANDGCGDPANGDCFIVNGNPGHTNVGPFCSDADCCDLVCQIRPFCCQNPGGEWDEVCVAIAQLFCQGGDRCASALAGNCFEVHEQNGGCNDPGCCGIVCGIDTFCCEQHWDQNCVDLALDNCINPNGTGPTPDFNAQQGYLRSTAYADQPGGIPPALSAPAPTFPGYHGEGWSLFSDSLLADNPTVTPTSVRWAGLYGLGRQLFEQYNIGTASGARGHGIKVAVIEWACYKNHEDLNVTVEPGQTMITIEDIGHPSHATACLGIINGLENGFGITGIAPDATAYFFPLTSVEEGPRITDAFLSCYATLGPGDVVSCSFGGGGNLNTNGQTHTLIQLGTDLAITTCVAAGNDCLNLDGTTDLGESGAIIVGASEPGDFHCRIPFSNHYETGTGSQVVHMSAWGECVTTLAGNALLWFPNGNWNRSYTSGFNGTSAATPQIAGLVACLQGLAKQFYNIPLSPSQIRTIIVNSGFPQCGVVNPDNLPGFDESLGCGPDADPDQEPNKIGPYPQPRDAGNNLINQFYAGFGDAPFVNELTILRGTLIYGNVFSIKGNDGNYLVVNSLLTNRRWHPSIPGPASLVNYYATGQTADIMVTAQAPLADINTLNTTVVAVMPAGISIVFTEMFDWTAQKWVNVGVDQPLPGPATMQHTAFNASRFVKPSDLSVLVRVYTLGVGYNGSPDFSNPASALNFTMYYDLIDVQGFGSFGGGPPGIGGG